MTLLSDIQKTHFVKAAKGLAESIRVSGLTPQQIKSLNVNFDNKNYQLAPSPNCQYNQKEQWAGCNVIEVHGENKEMIGTIDLQNDTFKPKGEGAGV